MFRKKWSATAAYNAFTLKVRILGIEPEIWRRISVPSALSLRELHAVIQGAMGWRDWYPHLFEIEGRDFYVPESALFGPTDFEDESKITLSAVLREGMEFSYVYDFEDEWKHVVTVGMPRILSSEELLPFCDAGELACPPEDCGGAEDYPDFLERIVNPEHPEHENFVIWARGWEPEVFSIAQANALIEAMCALYAERGWGFLEE